MTLLAGQHDVFKALEYAHSWPPTMKPKLCLTDLPYPTKERHRNRGTTTRLKETEKSNNPWFNVLDFEALTNFLVRLYGVMAADAFCFAYVDWETAFMLGVWNRLPTDLRELNRPGSKSSAAPCGIAGWRWWTPFVWVKTGENGQPRGMMGYHGRACTEVILCLEKGKPKWHNQIPNAFLAPRPRPKPKGATIRAATLKPISIAREIIYATTVPGDVVFDPFCGTGVHGVAAHDYDRVGIMSDVNLSLAKDWLKNVWKVNDAVIVEGT